MEISRPTLLAAILPFKTNRKSEVKKLDMTRSWVKLHICGSLIGWRFGGNYWVLLCSSMVMRRLEAFVRLGCMQAVKRSKPYWGLVGNMGI